LKDQIIERSAGTPLFCEEFIHMLIDEGMVVRDGENWRATGTIEEIRVPHSIHAVLAARLDLLQPKERSALQAASVIGQRFALGELQGLIDGSDVDSPLESLRRKGLVAGGDGANDEYHFRHLLIRDAAYGSLPKADRASLHDRLRSVLEAESGDPQQIAEILSHHAERSFTLSKELALDDELIAERAGHTVRWLLVMADRARTRNDIRVLEETLNSLNTVADRLPDGGGVAVRSQLRLLDAQLRVMKADYRGAQEAAAAAGALAEEANLLSVVATARLTEAWIANWSSGEGGIEHFQAVAERAIEAARQAGDVPAEIEARQIAATVPFALGRLDEFVETNRGLLEQARSIGDAAHIAAILERLTSIEQMRGNRDVANVYMAEADALAARLGLRNVAVTLLRARGTNFLTAGDFTAATESYRRFLSEAEDAGAVQQQVSALRFLSYALQFQDRYSEMAQALDRALQLSESSGERWNRTEVLALRARAALELGEIDDANLFIERAVDAIREDDVTALSEVNNHLGMIRAAQGREAEAESALRHSVELVADTEYMWSIGNAVVDLAKFLAQSGRAAEASSVIDEFPPPHGWHMWDGAIDEIRAQISALRPGLET
jgi:tetratricopeptide (TPR) repeat protein